MYDYQIWVQNICSVTDKMSILQTKCSKNSPLTLMHKEPLFKKLDILKFRDNIVLNNCLFVYD